MPQPLGKKIIDWFLAEKRKLPWREDPTPYRVWISEVMLQQTRASVVVDYFRRWMKKFPTIEALAMAKAEDVMKAWEGLGYYNRARNLHLAAKVFHHQYGGQIPDSYEKLLQVKGFGPYTAAAVMSFAFHQKAAAVDANVARVVSRFFLVEEDIGKPAVQKKLRELTERLLPDEDPWIVMEALIELGATLCGKTAQCTRCPLQDGCQAFQNEKVDQIPFKKKKKQTQYIFQHVVILIANEYVLVEQMEEGKVLGGLFQFPSFDGQLEQEEYIKNHFAADALWHKDLSKVHCSYTYFQVELQPSIWLLDYPIEITGYHWKKRAALEELPFSSGHKRILGLLNKEILT